MLKPRKALIYSSFLLIVLFTVSSCSYKSRNILFKTDRKIRTKEPVYVLSSDSSKNRPENYKHRIKPGDRLMIRFLNNYDIGQAAALSATSTANLQDGLDVGYLVNYDSTVTLPLIGRLDLVGLSRLEAAKKLEREYGKYVINPIIEVNIASLAITVLGEVVSPGKIMIDKENTSVVDVIALAGGLKDTGKKNTIKIIRGNDVVQVDLKRIESLKNKAIIMQDGDIVYVEPYGFKAQMEPISSLSNTTVVLLTVTQLIVVTLQVYNITR